MSDENFCECGCGQKTTISSKNNKRYGWIKGESRRFVHGHNSYGAKKPGNRYITPSGYVMVFSPGHPRSNNSGYVFEHILIIEKAFNRPLSSVEAVHHIDKDTTNNHIGNLMVFKTHSMHHAYEARLDAYEESGHYDWRKCIICHKYDDPKNLTHTTNSRVYHKKCAAEYAQNRKRNII